MEVEIDVDGTPLSIKRDIICYSEQNNDYRKYFVLPANISSTKLIFYIAPDQELRCEITGLNFEMEALESFDTPSSTLIKIK